MRIWVTGIGIVSPLGLSADETMRRLWAGERAFRKLSLFELPGARSDIAAEVEGLDVAAVAGGQAEPWSRTDAMAVLAAREALAHAGLGRTELPVDLAFGGSTAGMFETERLLAEMARDPALLAPNQQMLSHPLSATVDRMRQAVMPFRRARTVCSACSSGANAVLLGAAWIRAGRSERVLAGGADGLCRLTYAGFSALGALSAEPCQPFDQARSGLSLGEGAAFLLLESDTSARRRAVAPLAELRAGAIGSERHHITNPEPSGETAARVMAQALERGGLAPAEVDYVNAHGTATVHNDPMETQALVRCFGDAIERIRVSSSKGQIGHTLAAAGAVEAAITVRALASGLLPPTGGLEQVDPECELHHLRTTEAFAARAALSSSFGFGGMDTVLAFARPELFPAVPGSRPRRVLITGAASIGPLGVCAGPAVAAYLEPGPAPEPGPVSFEPASHLELDRARRIDRAGRLAAVVAQEALRASGHQELSAEQRLRAGAIVGAAFGAVDDAAGYVRRVLERGARFASPATFPNIVPSSPVAHASIYLGLAGAVFGSFDLGATSEGAMVTAVELVAAGDADLIVAGSVEQRSLIVERVLAPVCGSALSGVRSEGAAAVVVEAADEPSRPDGPARASRGRVAEVRWVASWRGAVPAALVDLPPAPEQGRVMVVTGRDRPPVSRLLAGSSWARVRCRAVADRAGVHEAAGGIAVAAAVGALTTDRLDVALVLGEAPDRGYALLLHAAQSAADGIA